MGTTQSGPRVITVEAGHGNTDVTVSQDFVNYITDKGQAETESLTEAPRAQDVLLGTPTVSDTLYREEKMKNEEYKVLTAKEFEEAALSVKNHLNESKVGQLIPVCEEEKVAVLSCYRENKRSLNCSNEVLHYTQCVEKATKGLLVQTLPVSLSNN